MPESVLCAVERGVATVTLNRPEVHNAFDDGMMRRMTEAFAGLGDDNEVRVVVLAGEGKSFCAGADLNWMKRMVGFSLEENTADARLLADMLLAVRDCPKPVIARVHGAAFGGGVGLVAACDLVLAVKEAKFTLSEVKLGLIPATISPFLLEKMGPQAKRYALTAERFDAVAATRSGLVTEVAESAEALDGRIGELVSLLKAAGPNALAACKRLFADIRATPWERVHDLTARRIAEARVSPEGQEGCHAFLEKRTPNWVESTGK